LAPTVRCALQEDLVVAAPQIDNISAAQIVPVRQHVHGAVSANEFFLQRTKKRAPAVRRHRPGQQRNHRQTPGKNEGGAKTSRVQRRQRTACHRLRGDSRRRTTGDYGRFLDPNARPSVRIAVRTRLLVNYVAVGNLQILIKRPGEIKAPITLLLALSKKSL